jgi:hypothetical protein
MIQLSRVSPDEARRSLEQAARRQRQVIAAYPFLTQGKALLTAAAAFLVASYPGLPHTPVGMLVGFALLVAFLTVPLWDEYRRPIRSRLPGPAGWLACLAWGALGATAWRLALAALDRAGVPASFALAGAALALFLMASSPALNRVLRRLAQRRADRVGARRGGGALLVGSSPPDALLSSTARLPLVAVLFPVEEMAVAAVRKAIGSGEPELSQDVAALVAAGYVQVRQGRVRQRPCTWLGLTPLGREAFDRHVAALRTIVSLTELSVVAGP